MNTPATTTANGLAVQPAQGGIRLVLNEGKNTLDQPTMKIQWFFSPAVLEKRPTKILIIEQNEAEDDSSCSGARYMLNVIDRVAFVQLQSPGKHRIVVLALTNAESRTDYMKRRRHRFYEDDVDLQRITDAIESGNFGRAGGGDVVAAAVQQIDIPAELFAPKGQSKLSKAVWAWTNRWHQSPPRDQCAYRARMIWAFTAQPILFALGHFGKFVFKILLTIFIPLSRILAWFIGFRPEPIFSDIKDLWTDLPNWDADVTRYGKKYRVWEQDREEQPTKLIPITGLEIVIFFGLVWFLASCPVLVLVLGCAALLVLSTVALSDRLAKVSGKGAGVSGAEPDLYAIWLKNLEFNRAPVQVDLKHLPPVYRGNLVQRFRVGFWDAKIKVCKPFAER